MTLDVRSLFTLSFVLGLVLGSLFLVLARMQPRSRLLRPFGLALLCLCAANAAFSTRNIAPDFVSIVLANAIAHVALVLIYEGVRRLNTSGPVKTDFLGWSFVAADFPLLIWFTYLAPDLATRIIMICLASAFLIGRIAWRIMAYSRQSGSLPSSILGALSGFVTFMMLFTAVATAVYGENSQDLLLTGPPMTVMFSVKPFLLLLISGTVLWLDFQRLRVEKSGYLHRTEAAITTAREKLIAQSEVEIDKNRNAPLCVALIDLDNFKAICKSHGPEAGHELVQWVEGVCGSALRPNDFLGRHSADQIAVVMPHTHLTTALGLAEDMRRRIEQGTCMVNDRPIRTTASIGVTRLQPDRTSWKDLVNSAQVAIFRARSAGRNRVEAATELNQKVDITQL